MATKYCDLDLSTGLNDGSSWANAWQSIAAVAATSTGAQAGDIVYVSHTSSEANASSTTYTFADPTYDSPCILLSVDKSDDSLDTTRGATFGTTSGGYELSLRGNVMIYGCTITSGRDFNFANNDNVFIRLYDCAINFTNTAAGTAVTFRMNGDQSPHTTLVEIIACDVDHANTNAAGFNGFQNEQNRGGSFFVDSCVWTASGGQSGNYVVEPQSVNAWDGSVAVRNSDLSVFDDIVDFNSNDNARVAVTIDGCELKAGYTAVTALSGPSHKVRITKCDSGAISAPVKGVTHWQDYYGTTKNDTARYRTGGASDGETSYSWEMVSTSNTIETYRPMKSPPMVVWTDDDSGGAKTLTVYIAGGADLNDDDFWIEVSSPNETANPNQTAQGNWQTTRADPLATPVALTRSSGTTWDGTGTGTDGGTGQQKIEVTLNPTEPGPVTVRCFLAKASTTVYVDPKPEIT